MKNEADHDAIVHDGRRQQTDSPVSVFLVMPVKEAAAEVEAVVMAGKAASKNRVGTAAS